jgi:Phage tail assembly chaperone protein, TAC
MGMRPKDFWNMTLIEWRAALSGFAERKAGRMPAAYALNGAELATLMLRFPDEAS